MTGETKTCSMDGCEVEFEARSHNQIFCSKEHQRIVTNQKIKDNYHDRKARRKGQERLCEVCGVTKLSRYNDSKLCQSCQVKSRENRDTDALAALKKVLS